MALTLWFSKGRTKKNGVLTEDLLSITSGRDKKKAHNLFEAEYFSLLGLWVNFHVIDGTTFKCFMGNYGYGHAQREGTQYHMKTDVRGADKHFNVIFSSY